MTSLVPLIGYGIGDTLAALVLSVSLAALLVLKQNTIEPTHRETLAAIIVGFWFMLGFGILIVGLLIFYWPVALIKQASNSLVHPTLKSGA